MDIISNNNIPQTPYRTGVPNLYDNSRIFPKATSSQQPAVPRKDKVNLSPEGIAAATQNVEESSTSSKQANSPAVTNNSELQLSSEEMQEIIKLTRRDTEVKAHEHAHLSTAGQYAAGGASFTFDVGPDGKRYAVGGEVPIDMSKESTPEATIQKMQIVARAALAPASPSSADRRIAAQAVMLQAQARAELQSGSGTEQSVSKAPENNKNSNASGEATSDGETSSRHHQLSPSGQAISPNSRQMILNAYTSYAA